MHAPGSNPQRRESFRCPVVGPRAECVLHVGDDDIPAQLLDESAGGFSVLIDRRPDFGDDPAIRLQTDSGWFDVQVVRVQEETSPKEGDDEARESAPMFRLGLRRLGEVAASDESPLLRPFAGLGNRLWHTQPSNVAMTALGTLLVLGVIVLSLHWAGILWPNVSVDGEGNTAFGKWRSLKTNGQRPTPQPSMLENGKRRGLEAAADAARSEKTLQKTLSLLEDLARGKPAGREDAMRAVSNFSFASERDLRHAVRSLSGATAMVLPDVVRRLQLTNAQQRQIRRIIDAAGEAVHLLDLEAPRQGVRRWDIGDLRAELLDRSLRDALGTLTPEQRATWEKMTAQPPAK